MNLQDLHQKAMNYLANFFTEHDDLPPTFLGLDAKKDLHILIAPGWSNGQKEFCQLFIKTYFVVKEVHAYAFASEAWFVTEVGKSPEELDAMPKPRDHPNRKEALVCGATNHTEKMQRAFYILRDKKNKPRIGPSWDVGCFDLMDNKDTERMGLGGALYDLLVDPKDVPKEQLPNFRMLIDMSMRQKLPSIPVIKVLTPAQYETMGN